MKEQLTLAGCDILIFFWVGLLLAIGAGMVAKPLRPLIYRKELIAQIWEARMLLRTLWQEYWQRILGLILILIAILVSLRTLNHI